MSKKRKAEAVLKVVECDHCQRPLSKFDSRPEPRWEPSCPYWNPHLGSRLCRPCYWRSMHDSEPSGPWAIRDMGSLYEVNR